MHELHEIMSCQKEKFNFIDGVDEKGEPARDCRRGFSHRLQEVPFFLYGQWRAKYAGVGMATRCEEGNTRKEERIVDFHAHSRISLALPFLRKITYLA